MNCSLLAFFGPFIIPTPRDSLCSIYHGIILKRKKRKAEKKFIRSKNGRGVQLWFGPLEFPLNETSSRPSLLKKVSVLPVPLLGVPIAPQGSRANRQKNKKKISCTIIF
jgi:hypothetical protein